LDERSHYSKIVDKHKSKAEGLATKVTSLTSRTVSAELQLKKSTAQVNRSTKRANDVNDYSESLRLRIIELESTVKQLQEQVVDLEVDLEEKTNKLVELEDSCPIKVFGKIRHGQRGATSWPLYVWELILEQLVNGTPPSSVSANIVMFIQRFSPRTKIKEQPSIWTVKRGRTVLLIVVETLAAYRIAKAKRWGQMHTDGTGRRQIAFQDLALTIEEDVEGLFEPLLITSCIIPRDERSETICEAVLHALEQKGKNLDEWRVVHERMFDTNHSIPPGSEIHLSKLEGGLINTDTCNAARLLGQLLVDAVDHAVQEKRELTGEVAINLLNGCHSAMIQDCHHHMRNVWVKAVTTELSVYLNKVLSDDLGEIDHRLRVSTMFDAILRALDKAVSLPANYPKGFGDMFKH
jgi:hypothetical protein